MSETEWLTGEELAKKEGISLDGVRKRAQRGQYQTKKEGRRTLYKPFPADGKPEKKEGGGGGTHSAQAVYLAAKARKMELDAQAAELRLNRERLLLYDEIREDATSALNYGISLLREIHEELIPREKWPELERRIKEIGPQVAERWEEYRAERAKNKATYNAELREGYEDFSRAKAAEERAEEAKKKKNKKPLNLETVRLIASSNIRDRYTERLVSIKGEAGPAKASEFDREYTELDKGLCFALEDAKTAEEVKAIEADYLDQIDRLSRQYL